MPNSISLANCCCLYLNQMRKEIGFIKGSSCKQAFEYSDSGGDSSDSFSSFDYDPRRDRQDEFSPYRHADNRLKDSQDPASPKKERSQQNKKEKESLRSREPPHFSNLILRNNFVKGKQLQQEYSSSSKESIDPVAKAQAAKAKKTKVNDEEREYEEELSLSNIHKFQKLGSLDENKEQKAKLTKEIFKRQYVEENLSSSSEEKQKLYHFQQKKTVAGRQKQKQQQLITEYDKREFKDKTIKRAILEHHSQNYPQKRNNMVEAKGGICFEVDKTAFKGKPSRDYPKKKKAKNSDPRLQLLQRRQDARNYDRQSRSHLFAYY